MITQTLMKTGGWSLDLVESTPRRLLQLVANGAHLVITPARLDLANGISDANMLASAIYTGVITRRPSPTAMEGHDLSWWLGTPDGVGPIIEAKVTLSSSTLADAVGAVLPTNGNGITVGSVTNTGTNVTGEFVFITRREYLDAVCRAAGAEWIVAPDGSFSAAVNTTLFESNPDLVITRHTEGPDSTYRGIAGGPLVKARTIDSLTRKVIVAAKGEGSAIVGLGSATAGTFPYTDLSGSTPLMTRIVDASSAAGSTPANNIATATLAMFDGEEYELTISSDTYALPMHMDVGDWVYVWDPDADLIDTTNQITWRGDVISPLKVRVYEISWPVQRGMGVYLRVSGSTYYDLSDWVDWETGATRWKVGKGDSPLSGVSGQTTSLGVNQVVAERLARQNVVAGSTVGTTNASGELSISFGYTFPGSVYLTICNGDTAAGAADIWGVKTVTTTGATVVCYTHAGVARNGATVRCNWVAVGPS